MKHVTIIIPTLNRNVKLTRCLASIPMEKHKQISVMVGFDGDSDSMTKFVRSHNLLPTVVMCTWTHLGSLRVGNILASMAIDGLLCAVDDILFRSGGVLAAIEEYNKAFPEDDGVLGIGQMGIPDCCPTGISLMGKNWLRRYENKWPFYPGYFHFFGDKEIHLASEKMGKFQQASTACGVYHYHPAYHESEIDETHAIARTKMSEDRDIFYYRQRTGLLWGVTDGINKGATW